MSEPSNIFAKDLGIDVNINPVKNDSVYNKPIGITNRDTGIVEYDTAYNDIYLCVLHDKDSFGKYNSVDKTFDGSYTDTISIKISKQNSAFDFAKKFNEYLIHSKYKNNIRFNNFIEDATKDAGKLVYERIQNLANNITNVDTCKWRNLASTYKMYDIDIKNVVSSEFPEELDFLLNIFSLPREYILNNFYKTDLSNNNIVAAAQSMDKKVTDLFQEKYYNNFYEKIVFPAVKQQLYNNFSNEKVFNYIKLVNSNIYDDLYNHIQNNYVEQYYPLFDALLSVDAQNMIYSYYQTMKYDLMYKVPNLNINILTRENPDVANDGTNYLKEFLSTIEWNGEKELFKVFIDEYLPPLAFINMQKIDTCARHITNMCSKLFTLRKSIKDILIKDSMIGTGLLIEQMIYDYILEQFTQKIGINNKYKLGNKEVNYDSIYNTPLESIMDDLYNLDPKNSDNYYNEAKIAKLLGVEFDDRFSSLKQLASVLNASIIEYTDTTPNYLNIIPPNPVNHKEVESRTVMTYPRYLNADGVIVYYNYNDPEQSYYINESGREILPNPRWNYNTTNKTRGDIMYVDSSGTDCKILQLENSSIAPYYYNADNPFYGMWYKVHDTNNCFIQWQDRQDKENFMSLIEMKNLGLSKNGYVVSPTNTYNTDLKFFYGNNNRITYENKDKVLSVKNSSDSGDISTSTYSNAITCAGEVYFDVISKYDDVIETKRVTKVVNSYNDEIIKYVDSSVVKDDNNDITTLLREKPVGVDIKYIKFTKNESNGYTAYNMDTFTKVDEANNSTDAEYIKGECIVSNFISPNKSTITYSYDVTFGPSANNPNLIKLNSSGNYTQSINILIERGDDSNTSTNTGSPYIVCFISYEYNGKIIDSLTLTDKSGKTFTIDTGIVYRTTDTDNVYSKFLTLFNEAGSTTISYNVPYLVNYTYRSKNNPSIVYMEYKNVGPNGETIDQEITIDNVTKRIKTDFNFPNDNICYDSEEFELDQSNNTGDDPIGNYISNIELENRLITGVINPNEVPYLIIKKDIEVYKLCDHTIKFETIDGIRQVSEISDSLLYEDETGQIIDNKNNLYYYTVDGYDYGDEYTYDYNKRQLIHKSSEKIVNDYSFNVNLVYSLANQKSKIITNEKVVNSLIKEGFDPFWNDLTLDSTLLYGDLTLEDERDIVMFYRRLGLISDDLPTNYKEQLEDGKVSLTPEWAIARAKIIDILKAVWTNYAQHTWYNEYDDNKALEDGLMSEATIQMLKEIDKRYGSNLGTTDTLDKTKIDPWLPLDYSLVNLPNWANHTVAVHPFVWSLVQKTYNIYLDTLYITMYDEHVLSEIYTNVTSYELNPDGGDDAISKITDRIDETTSDVGELGGYYITNTFDKIFNVNNWLYYNRDFSGYASKYQESINEDSRNSKTSRFFDFDGPFNYEALMEIIEYTNDPSDEDNEYSMEPEDLQDLVDTAASWDGGSEGRQQKLNEEIWGIISTYYKYYQDCDI